MPDTWRMGSIYAGAAFAFWGLTPIYYKLLPHVPPAEILAHRVVWSVIFGGFFLTVTRGWPAVRDSLRVRHTRRALMLTAVLISVNWLVYIAAIARGQLLSASLGYYINPLVTFFLGVVFLGEKLNSARATAVTLAVIGTLTLAVEVGGLPWVSVTLAFSFGFYGLIRKRLGLPGMPALFVETLLVAPFAVLALAWFHANKQGCFGADLQTSALLVLAGPVTLLPLLWFAEAARRLPLVTLGFFQYLSPTLTFLLATWVYGEAFNLAWGFTFLLIWSALAVFSIDGLRARQRLSRGARGECGR